MPILQLRGQNSNAHSLRMRSLDLPEKRLLVGLLSEFERNTGNEPLDKPELPKGNRAGQAALKPGYAGKKS